MASCRVCHNYDSESRMVRYGVRHMAHHACYLDAGKTLSDLHPWQIRQFPWRVLKERGLIAEAERLTPEKE